MKPPLTSAHTHPIYLTQRTQHATIHTYPLKGGTHDYHAGQVLDTQGGGRPLQSVRRNCQEVYQTEEAASNPVWRSTTYLGFGLAGVHREAEQKSSRINSFILSVAGSTPTVSEALSVDPCSSYRWEPLVQSHCVLFYPCQEGKSRTRGDRRVLYKMPYGNVSEEQRFNRLVVLQRGEIKGHQQRWRCQCDCGQIIQVYTFELVSGRKKQCPSCSRLSRSKKWIAIQPGQRVGSLVTISRLDQPGRSKWTCQCDCGAIVIVPANELNRQYTRLSCHPGAPLPSTPKQRVDRLPIEPAIYGYSSYKSSAKARGLSFEISKERFKALTQSNCYYCGIAPSQRRNKNSVDHRSNGIDRIDSSKGYVEGNVRPCCTDCNLAKRDLSEQDFYTWVQRIASHWKMESEAIAS